MPTVTIDNKIKQVIANIRNLPTPPVVFHQIQKVINDPTVSADHIASILAEDPAMSVKVLKLTNSAFYGLNREIDSVKQAIVIVGIDAIKNLVLSASVLDMFKGKNIDQEYNESYWRHSLATAFCSRLLAKKEKKGGIVDPDAAFSAGLLHDVGKMVISCFLPKEYEKFKNERETDQKSLDYEVEDRTLGFNHAQIGGFLSVQWKIPHKLTNAIIHHHYPQACDEEDALTYVVCIANYLAKKTFYDSTSEHLIGSIDKSVLEYMQVSIESLEGYKEELRDEYLKSETFMQMVGLTV